MHTIIMSMVIRLGVLRVPSCFVKIGLNTGVQNRDTRCILRLETKLVKHDEEVYFRLSRLEQCQPVIPNDLGQVGEDRDHEHESKFGLSNFNTSAQSALLL